MEFELKFKVKKKMKKIDETWDSLKPREDEESEGTGFEKYYKRISQTDEFKHIPKQVLRQWIHPHHQKGHTLNNYAWINYINIEFELSKWTYDELRKVFVIKDFKDFVSEKGSLTDFNQFSCNTEDLEYWKKNGTWKVPPIILDLDSISSEFPSWVELKRPYQLVEGHSRLGYLRAMKKISESKKGKLASKHMVYLMKGKKTIS